MLEQLSNVSSIFPITVVAAIVLFVVKEIFEFFKRRSERARKIVAYKILISEELEKNVYSICCLRDLCGEIEKNSFVSMTYYKLSTGDERLRFHYNVEGEGPPSEPLPCVHTSVFDKAVVDIAVLSKGLFESARSTYESLAEVKNVRNHFVSLSEDETTKVHLKGLPGYAYEKLDRADFEVKRLYKMCTGDELSDGKVRSYI